MEEIYIRYFGEQFKKNYSLALNNIIKHVKDSNDCFSVSKYKLNYDDLDKKKADSDYLNDKSFSLKENGIEILVPLIDFWNDIKKYIPKSITTLEIPCSYIENDIDFLASFPNLETLVITDYARLFDDELKKISEITTIKKILALDTYDIKKHVSENKSAAIDYPYNYLIYGDLVYCNVNNPDIDDYLSRGYKNSVDIYTYELDKDLIEKLYNIIDDRLKEEIIIHCNDLKYTINFNKDSSSCSLKIDGATTTEVNKFFDYLSNNGIRVNKITWKLQDKNYYDLDVSPLENVASKAQLFIDYGNNKSSSFEDFKGLLESVRWYRQIIMDSNLSPVEKVMYAFDIVKTFKYNEADNKEDSRYAHRIIETGNIVCVGYSDMLEQILNYLDDNIKIIEFGVDCYKKTGEYRGGHSRNMLKIDDDKYNIHGIFVLDATWDSDKSHVVDSDFLPGYTSLDLYRYFLVPVSDYEKTFSGDTLPNLFKCYLDRDYSKYGFKSQYEGLFGNEYIGDFFGKKTEKENVNEKVNNFNLDSILNELESMTEDKKNDEVNYKGILVDEELKKYLSVLRPTLSQFTEMLINVRLSQGYSKNDTIEEVKKVIEINKKVIQNMNSDGDEIEFFKEEKGVSK